MGSRKRSLPQPLEPEELRAILKQPNPRVPTGLRNRTLIALMAESGLRVGEVCSLTLSDIGTNPDRLRIIDGKGGDRTVYLTVDGSNRLAQWLAVRAKYVPKTSRYVFCQIRSTAWTDPKAKTGAKEAGSQLSTAYIRALTARLGHKAGVERRTNPHAFRHTAATMMVEEDFTLPEVAEMLGHANIATTSVYTHVRDARLAARVRASKGISGL